MANKGKVWLGLVALIVVAATLMDSMPAVAQTYDPSEDLPRPTGVEKALTKLGRGLSNIMFGWAEIPLTFHRKLQDGKPLAYLLGVSPVLGTARALMRTSTGVFEAVSFPFSNREVNYEAVLEPDYIF
ncbi:MAG TPA: exosortase system-associated protein, TIGR04073 family [Candidatus Hydrogenedentes bacterium]|nr:exosortase system-associated protein, TIGR04073 family [Candidatus Hydrogenedentota bacterium]HPG68467.1 exosortase system-associated protein, TIGR04073 family [Candidatus Hydrogenedentota bacterium]